MIEKETGIAVPVTSKSITDNVVDADKAIVDKPYLITCRDCKHYHEWYSKQEFDNVCPKCGSKNTMYNDFYDIPCLIDAPAEKDTGVSAAPVNTISTPNNAVDTNITIVYVSTDLCSACQTFEPTFKALKEIYKNQKNIKFYSIKKMENDNNKLVYNPAELTADEKKMLSEHLSKCKSVPYVTINGKKIDDAYNYSINDFQEIINPLIKRFTIDNINSELAKGAKLINNIESGKTNTVEPHKLFNIKLDTSYGIVGLDQAKEALENNLRLRAHKDQPQKIILLGGHAGTGKTTLITNICQEFCKKFPDRFTYKIVSIIDLMASVNKASDIDDFWNKIPKEKSKILFIDEAEEILHTRKTDGFIRNTRTNLITNKLNLEMPNLLIILATNRPKMIDPAILSRCGEQINCDLPVGAEILQIIKLHMPFLDENKQNILFKYLVPPYLKVTGRDIKNLALKFKEILDIKELDHLPEIVTDEEIAKQFHYFEQSKKHLKDDYLDEDEEDDAQYTKRKSRRKQYKKK